MQYSDWTSMHIGAIDIGSFVILYGIYSQQAWLLLDIMQHSEDTIILAIKGISKSKYYAYLPNLDNADHFLCRHFNYNQNTIRNTKT